MNEYSWNIIPFINLMFIQIGQTVKELSKPVCVAPATDCQA